MQKAKTYISYSENFKLMVVRAYESGHWSIGALRRRYGIAGNYTIQRWLKRYGKQDLLAKKVIIMQADEQSEQKRLRARIKELEAAVVQLQLDKLEAQSYLEVACERLGHSVEELKKKPRRQP